MKYMENAIMYLFKSFKIQKRKQLKFNNYSKNVIMTLVFQQEFVWHYIGTV